VHARALAQLGRVVRARIEAENELVCIDLLTKIAFDDAVSHQSHALWRARGPPTGAASNRKAQTKTRLARGLKRQEFMFRTDKPIICARHLENVARRRGERALNLVLRREGGIRNRVRNRGRCLLGLYRAREQPVPGRAAESRVHLS
jgi:hypothetical protein